MPESDKNGLKNYVFIPKTKREEKPIVFEIKKNAFSTQNLNPFFWDPIKTDVS